jgi:peptidyl-prolyl cis-trans isomerase SurA
LKGDDFGKLAAQFSNDMVSAAANGQMQEFGTGQYDVVFEKTVFALPKDGAVSKPFLTSHGYHIVKRIGKTPVSHTKNEKLLSQLREKVEQSDRMTTTKSLLAKKILKEAGYQKASFNNTELWAYSDSALNNQVPKTAVHLTGTSPLFSFKGKDITVSDWITYSQTFRYKPDGSGVKPYAQVWDEFVEASALDYYQSHLEDYNEDFRQQINEFKDGNLFFEIMQRQVWGPAQTDSTALLEYYQKNKTKYNWKQSADAVIFYASDAATAKSFLEDFKKSPTAWQQLVNDMSEKIAADSSRFEVTQIPNPTTLPWEEGTITSPLINKADNTASFAYIIKYYPQQEPRSFADAKGLVITDYQNDLEKTWLQELRKKYPVIINQKALDELKRKKEF